MILLLLAQMIAERDDPVFIQTFEQPSAARLAMVIVTVTVLATIVISFAVWIAYMISYGSKS